MVVMLMSKDEQLQEILSFYPEIIAVYLFGSYLKDTEQARDIDLAVLTSQITGTVNLYMELYPRLAEIFSPLEVDLLFLQNATLPVTFEVIYTGKVVYCSDDDKRTDYEYVISGRYMDFKYHLDIGQKELYEAIKEGVNIYV